MNTVQIADVTTRGATRTNAPKMSDAHADAIARNAHAAYGAQSWEARSTCKRGAVKPAHLTRILGTLAELADIRKMFGAAR